MADDDTRELGPDDGRPSPSPWSNPAPAEPPRYGQPGAQQPPAVPAPAQPQYGQPAQPQYGQPQASPAAPYGQPPAGYGQPPPPPPQYGVAPGYGQQPYPAQAYGAAPRTSGRAVAVLVCAIASFVLLPLIPAIVALALAPGAAREIRESGGAVTGEGLVKAGRIVAWIAVALAVIGLLFLGLGLILATRSGGSTDFGTPTGY